MESIIEEIAQIRFCENAGPLKIEAPFADGVKLAVSRYVRGILLSPKFLNWKLV